MNWHEMIDRRNHEMDQVIVSVLRECPAKLDLVVEWIHDRLEDPDFSLQSKDGLREWLDLIRARGLAGVLEVLSDRSEAALRMRQSSPFAILMPEEERMKILDRYETLRARAYPAGV